MADCKNCKRTDIKCCPTCARDGYTCNVWHKCEEDCEGYEPRIKTNFDRIKDMSVEELAEFLPSMFNMGCTPKYILELLKSEAKE